MWESRSDFQGRWETKGNLGLVFLVFHASVISMALSGFILMRSSCAASPRITCAWLLAFPSRLGCRISPRQYAATDPLSTPRAGIQPIRATAARSPTASHTSGRHAFVYLWRSRSLRALRTAGESSDTD